MSKGKTGWIVDPIIEEINDNDNDNAEGRSYSYFSNITPISHLSLSFERKNPCNAITLYLDAPTGLLEIFDKLVPKNKGELLVEPTDLADDLPIKVPASVEIKEAVYGDAFRPTLEALIRLIDFHAPIPKQIKQELAEKLDLSEHCLDYPYQGIKSNISETIPTFLMALKCKAQAKELPKLPKPVQYQIIGHLCEPAIVPHEVVNYSKWEEGEIKRAENRQIQLVSI